MSNPSLTLKRALRAYHKLVLGNISPLRSHKTAGRAKILSPAECTRLVARYQEGATVYELAGEFGVHRGTIARRLKAEGVKLRSQPLSKADARKAVELYTGGQSILQIGAELSRHHSTILACAATSRRAYARQAWPGGSGRDVPGLPTMLPRIASPAHAIAKESGDENHPRGVHRQHG